ncbi:MAG: hypothetical protein NC248_09405 [Bacteroides sp.]|nr:hypothetical protein [Bacteroides sp.]MCM1389832.1 hypothetical protein [Bacteroides sp.]
MKKKILYGLIALTSMSVFSCKDDDPIGEVDGASVDRKFMTMFRRDDNTNRGSDDDYACGLVEGTLNSLYLAWYGVNGAAGYQIVVGTSSCSGPDRWADPANILMDTVVGPDVLSMTLEHLNYGYTYAFSIRTLDPRGVTVTKDGGKTVYDIDDTSPHHSKWYGRGDERHNSDYFRLETDPRYDQPEIITISDRTDDSFRVNFDLGYTDGNEYPEFERDENGRYVAQILSVTASASNPDAKIDPSWAAYPLTPDDYARGYVDVTGLEQNSAYVVDILNMNKEWAVDRGYNIVAPRTTGDVGQPVVLWWQELRDGAADTIPEARDPQFNCARLDTVFTHFNKDASRAEGTVFELEGGKNYYLYSGPEVMKGFTLRTRPEDVAQGKRAMVFLGGITRDPQSGDPQCCNWQWGKVPAPGESGAPIMVGDIIFENIDFSSPLAQRYNAAQKKDGTGNYFGNCHRNAAPVSFNSMQLKNCSFQDFIRGGFARVQGNTRKSFDMILIENCVMWNCGYWTDSGGGYNWLHGNESANIRSNVFRNVIYRGNTFVDSPHGYLVHDKDKNNAWPSNVRWKFTIENNTFLNYCTRSGQQMLKLRYIPGDTEFHVHNNLFIQAKDDADDRKMNLTLVDIRTINTEPYFGITVDISGNYGCTWDPANQKENGTPTGGKFSDAKNSFGNMTSENGYTPGIVNGVDELSVHCGSTPLLPTELMRSPNPPYHNGDPKMHQRESLDGLFYNHTEKVTNHEIYKLGIGDTRWRDASDMKSFWLLKAND